MTIQEDSKLTPLIGAGTTAWCQRDGHLYFIRIRADKGAIKIGFTEKDVMKRVMSVQQNSPHDVLYIGCIEAKAYDEPAFHKRFAASHLKGEWFRPTEEVMGFILQQFPDYSEVRSVPADEEAAVIQAVKEIVGFGPVSLGMFYDILWDMDADVIRVKMWLFHNQSPTRGVLDATREALAKFKLKTKRAA